MLKKKFFKNKQGGQTLIEAIVALSTILIIVAAIATVIIGGLYNSQFIKSQNLANKYGQQGIELVKNIQQNNLAIFKDTYCGVISDGDCGNSGTWCIDTSNNTLTQDVGKCSGVNVPGTNLHREITFVAGDGVHCLQSELQVNVKVSWSSTKCSSSDTFCHSSNLASCMPFEDLNSNP